MLMCVCTAVKFVGVVRALLAKILYNSVLCGVLCFVSFPGGCRQNCFVKLILSNDVNGGNRKKITFKRQKNGSRMDKLVCIGCVVFER